MNQLLRKARLFLASQRPLPADLAAQLAAVGVDVAALETNFNEQQQVPA